MSYLINCTHETGKILRQHETDDCIFYLERVYYYDFQETSYIVADYIGEYYETFDNLEEAEADFNDIVKRAEAGEIFP